jgi:hypothetical protein
LHPFLLPSSPPHSPISLFHYECIHKLTPPQNHHPSLALWAGGNELEAIILFFFFSATNPSGIQKEYEQVGVFLSGGGGDGRFRVGEQVIHPAFLYVCEPAGRAHVAPTRPGAIQKQ